MHFTSKVTKLSNIINQPTMFSLFESECLYVALDLDRVSYSYLICSILRLMSESTYKPGPCYSTSSSTPHSPYPTSTLHHRWEYRIYKKGLGLNWFGSPIRLNLPIQNPQCRVCHCQSNQNRDEMPPDYKRLKRIERIWDAVGNDGYKDDWYGFWWDIPQLAM